MGYAYVLLTVIFTVLGQLIIKWRVSQLGLLPGETEGKIHFLLQCLIDPFIIFGLFSAFLAALMWILAMAKMDISEAYPVVTALLTLLTALGGIFILSEPLSWQKVAGIALVCLGVFVMSR